MARFDKENRRNRGIKDVFGASHNNSLQYNRDLPNDITLCSYLFNDVDSHIDLGNTLNGIIEGANKVFSVGIVFRRLGIGGDWMFSNWDSVGNNRSFLMNFNGTDNFKMSFSLDGTGVTGTFTSDNAIVDDDWHMVIISYNAGVVTTFMDGVVNSGTSVTIPSTLHAASTDVSIGDGQGGLQIFNGYMNQVFVTSDVITLQEAEDLWNNGSPRIPSDILDNLEREWIFDNDTWDGANWDVIDAQGNGNGTSVNMLAVDRDCNENPY